jgi:hypothetical protein
LDFNALSGRGDRGLFGEFKSLEPAELRFFDAGDKHPDLFEGEYYSDNSYIYSGIEVAVYKFP